MKRSDIILAERIEQTIFTIRGQKVMLDFHLARLYGVHTKSLNLAVKRNSGRFPEDFVFQLTSDEFGQVKAALRFQFETSNTGRDGSRLSWRARKSRYFEAAKGRKRKPVFEQEIVFLAYKMTCPRLGHVLTHMSEYTPFMDTL